MEIVFATGNANKVREVETFLGEKVQLLSLKDIGCLEELPETSATIEGNASQKAFYVFEHYGANCFADDTGLEVSALDGAPGVYSARYAGPQCLAADNIAKLLADMVGKTNRRACFRTVISLVIDAKEHQFEGRVDGTIIEAAVGTKGFGYDPVFKPEGLDMTFGELSLEEKNAISHRGLAVTKLREFLNGLQEPH